MAGLPRKKKTGSGKWDYLGSDLARALELAERYFPANEKLEIPLNVIRDPFEFIGQMPDERNVDEIITDIEYCRKIRAVKR